MKIDYSKLLSYGEAGVNRLSIGLQSANDGELRSVGRIHTYEQFLEGYNMARELGYHEKYLSSSLHALMGMNFRTFLSS